MFRSISSQLQFSYGLLVLIALVGLGIFGFLHQKSKLTREVDESLQLRSKRINSMMVRHDLQGLVNPGRGGDLAAIPSLPPLPSQPAIDGKQKAQAEIYYKVWRADGESLRLIFQSSDAPEVTGSIPLPKDIPEAGIATVAGAHRQHLSRAVRNYVILVGTDFSAQKAGLRQFLIQMIVGELAFFILFILAGYWLTKRALSPIGQISDTARTIADGALDQRIPIEAGSSELKDLSLVLNESFDHLEGSILRQREFTSNASHELRTPITAILSEGQSKPKSVEEYRASLDRCVGTARSMGQLVDQLLELSRFDSGDRELQREATDLDILVDRAIQMVRPMAEEKSIQIETKLEVAQADVNAVRITQVVLNLLTNAISYTGENGRVEVQLTESEKACEIVIRDNGIGIPEEDLPHIFDRFYQADKSRSDHEGGHFGLGLAISQEIASAHGGDLRVESEVGKSSVFTLNLPV